MLIIIFELVFITTIPVSCLLGFGLFKAGHCHYFGCFIACSLACVVSVNTNISEP